MKLLLSLSTYALAIFIVVTHYVYYDSNTTAQEFFGYLAFSNVVNFFLMVIVFVKIKADEVLRRSYYAPFSLTSIQILVNRFLNLFKDWTIVVVFLSAFSMLFHQEFSLTDRILYTSSLLLQQAFSILFFITLWDFLVQLDFEQHLNLIPPLVITLVIFGRTNNYNFIYWANPIGGVINIPLFIVHNKNAYYLSFLLIPLFFGVIFIINKLFINYKPV